MPDQVRLKPGDKIRVPYYYGTEDYVVEEFRQCLGIFESNAHRKAQNFTPLCAMFEMGPKSEKGYIGNYGEYYTNPVPIWMNLPKD